MIVEPVGIVTLAAGALCLVFGLRLACPLLILSTLLGSAAALILPAFGYANIQPAHLLLPFCVLAALRQPSAVNGIMRCMSYPRAGFWLLLAVLYGAVWAYVGPRLFWGQTSVFGLRSDTGGIVPLWPLEPGSGNLTQSMYFAADLVCFALVCAYAGGASGRRRLGAAVLAAATVNLIFAALDLATYLTD